MDSKVAKLQNDVKKFLVSESEMAKFEKRITQSEVEGQLEVMKQRRLSRMNILEDEEQKQPVEKAVKTIPYFKSTVETISNVSQISKQITHKSDRVRQLSTFRNNIHNTSDQSLPAENGQHRGQSQRFPDVIPEMKLEQRKTIYYRDNEAMPLDSKRFSTKNTTSDCILITSTTIDRKEETKESSKGSTIYSSIILPDKRIPSKVPSFHSTQSSSDKVLKKFQLNWTNINEILEHNSKVDMDELKDLRNSLEEMTSLMGKYQEGLKRLEQVKVSVGIYEKMATMKCQVEELKQKVVHFRGLRRDSGYLHLSNKLSNIYLEINKIPDSSFPSNEKKEALAEINAIIRDLETTVKKNQSYLEFILNEQVLCVRKNHTNRSSKI